MPLFDDKKVALSIFLGERVFEGFEKYGISFQYMALGTPAAGYVSIDFIIQKPYQGNWEGTHYFDVSFNKNRLYWNN